MKKKLVVMLSVLLLAGFVAGCEDSNSNMDATSKTKIVVGCTANPHADILKVAQPLLEEEGYTMEIKTFTDYVLLNPALVDGQIDANFFQHIPYLEDYNAENQQDLVWTVKVHNEPMGIYSKKITNLADLKDSAKVGIPNDNTNRGRALMVLEAADLIKLKDNVDVRAAVEDIVENPKQLAVVPMDAAMLPRSLEDMDICVINSNYALEGGLDPVKDSIFSEAKDSPFANVLVVKPEDKDNPAILALGKALQSNEVKTFLDET